MIFYFLKSIWEVQVTKLLGLLGSEIMEPETDVMVQFLAPEIVIMGQRYFMQKSIEQFKIPKKIQLPPVMSLNF